MVRLRVICRAVMLIALPGYGSWAAGQGGSAADTATTTRVDPRSPRAAIEDFLSLARRGQFAAASRYVRVGADAAPVRDAELARRLREVLDQYLTIDLELVSPLATGDTTDGLPNGRDNARDQLGTIRNGIGVLQPVQLQRLPPGSDPAWVFAPSTVARVDAWYGALGDRWLRDRMPRALQQPGPLGVNRWQWVGLALLLVIAIAIGWIAEWLSVAVARHAVRRTATALDDRLLEHARGPLLALWSVVAYRALVEIIGLSIAAGHVVGLMVRASCVVIITWFLIRATHVFEDELPLLPLTSNAPQVRAFAPLLGRVARIFLLALGAIALVAQFGYSVTALLTGVGIGGIALAFAAQKTLEHPFGSVAIGLDQPIRVGDWVRVGDVEGEVEAIGLRSTRIRTMERTVVVFPNGRLAELQMENFGMRDRILLRTRIGLTYDTTAGQLRRVRDDLEGALAAHPLVWRERIIVRFIGFGTSSLDLDVIAWIATTDYNVFRDAREELLFRFMEIVRGAGCSFAFPTQTVQVKEPGAPAASPPAP